MTIGPDVRAALVERLATLGQVGLPHPRRAALSSLKAGLAVGGPDTIGCGP
jgi:hypothetical protein